jgi:hypothetical protein
MTTPIPEGPGFPRHPPSTYATKSGITRFFAALCKIEDAPISFCRQDDYLIPFQPFAIFDSLVQFRVQKRLEIPTPVNNFLLYIHLHFWLCTARTQFNAPKLCVDFFECSVNVTCVDGRKGWHNNTEPIRTRLSDQPNGATRRVTGPEKTDSSARGSRGSEL